MADAEGDEGTEGQPDTLDGSVLLGRPPAEAVQEGLEVRIEPQQRAVRGRDEALVHGVIEPGEQRIPVARWPEQAYRLVVKP